MDFRKTIAVALLVGVTPAAFAATDCLKCGLPLVDDELRQGYCDDCGFLVPAPEKPPTPNGVAVYNFGAEVLGYDLAPILAAEIAGTEKMEPYVLAAAESGEYMKFIDLTAAFRAARSKQQELVLIGAVNASDGLKSITAEVFDIETGYLVASGSADITAEPGLNTTESRVKEFAAALARDLPYRGRYLRPPGAIPAFEFASGLKTKSGARVEICRSYDYPSRECVEGEGEERRTGYWYDLTRVEPKVVVADPYKLEIKPGRGGEPGRLRVKGLQFQDGDICYYYPPPEKPAVNKIGFGYLGLAFATHSYNYAEDLDSREDAGSASIGAGRRFKLWGLPFKLAGGVTFDAPLRYDYAYGDGREGRGRIMGAYVASLNAALDWKMPVGLGWFTRFVPWLGAEVGYFLPYGHGVYEEDGGTARYQRYESELWNGVVVGVRSDWELVYFGSRKQYGLATGVCYYPAGFDDYGAHFGPLWRFPLGVRYYF